MFIAYKKSFKNNYINKLVQHKIMQVFAIFVMWIEILLKLLIKSFEKKYLLSDLLNF